MEGQVQLYDLDSSGSPIWIEFDCILLNSHLRLTNTDTEEEINLDSTIDEVVAVTLWEEERFDLDGTAAGFDIHFINGRRFQILAESSFEAARWVSALAKNLVSAPEMISSSVPVSPPPVPPAPQFSAVSSIDSGNESGNEGNDSFSLSDIINKASAEMASADLTSFNQPFPFDVTSDINANGIIVNGSAINHSFKNKISTPTANANANANANATVEDISNLVDALSNENTLAKLTRSAADAANTRRELDSLVTEVSILKTSHSVNLSALVQRAEIAEAREDSAQRHFSFEKQRNDENERLVTTLEKKLDHVRKEAASDAIRNTSHLQEAVGEVTLGVEEMLKNERRRNASNFNKFRAEELQKGKMEFSRAEEKLKKRFASEKAIELAQMATAHSDEMHRLRTFLENDYKKKIKKVKSDSDLSNKQTSKDVQQLTNLHRSHILALETALKDETKRLSVARSELTRVTLARASDAAMNASAREVEVNQSANMLKELARLKQLSEKSFAEKEKAEVRASAGLAEITRIDDSSRLKWAEMVGLKSRLSESEAESLSLRRDLENIRVKGRVEGGMLDREATEKAVLVKENYELRNQLERMRVALRNVNKNIYGEKASEYCMKMAHAEVKWSGSNQITKKRLQTKAKSNIKKAWRSK